MQNLTVMAVHGRNIRNENVIITRNHCVLCFAFVAQWIEHPPPKGRVARSIRAEGTILKITLLLSLPTP